MKSLFKTKKQKATALLVAIGCFSSYAQEKTKQDSIQPVLLKEVVVSGVRAKIKAPITFTNVKTNDIEVKNLGQDIPVLLDHLPSVVSSTDAGNGIGYTSMRVRGADGTRVNVTLNGVPLNDAESQGSFFVNLPDFSSSLQSIQLQRGVGTSTNGSGAFGASLNMETKGYQKKAHATIANTVGSFNTRKHSLSFGTGLHNNLEFNGRISTLNSDGYIDRAFSKMFGYYFNANYIKNTTLIKAIAFGGKQKTYQAWYGLEDEEKLQNDRTFNPAGMYTDNNNNVQFYDDETDNYWQNHFQLHWTEKWSQNWTSNVTLHYTKGKGYYKQYKEDESLSDYYLPNYNGNSTSDVIRKKWLDNHFFGSTFSLNYKKAATDVLLGGAINRYLGDHYGEAVWTQYQGNITPPKRYYDNFGRKEDVTSYIKVSHSFNKLNVFADIQYRMVFYKANSDEFDDVNDTFRFFNPKLGINYQLNSKNAFYAYFGIANKEPRRDDYENGSTKSERLFDYELGWKYSTPKMKITANAYYMNYKNQLVLTGALNNVGAPIFTNSGKSYRYGLELSSKLKVSKLIQFEANTTFSQNKNKDFYFQRDGVLTNLGDTTIAFSPSVIANGIVTVSPIKNLEIALIGKHVSEQYMGNIDAEKSIIRDYTIANSTISYNWEINKGIQSIVFSGLVNNLFDRTYESNGYFYTYDSVNAGVVTTVEGAGYYPQAGINFLAGITIKL